MTCHLPEPRSYHSFLAMMLIISPFIGHPLSSLPVISHLIFRTVYATEPGGQISRVLILAAPPLFWLLHNLNPGMESSLQVSLSPDPLVLGLPQPRTLPLPSAQLSQSRPWRFGLFLFHFFTPILIHLVLHFRKHLSSYHMLGAVLDTEERAENRFPTAVP